MNEVNTEPHDQVTSSRPQAGVIAAALIELMERAFSARGELSYESWVAWRDNHLPALERIARNRVKR